MNLPIKLTKFFLSAMAISLLSRNGIAQQQQEQGFPFIRNYEPKEYGYGPLVFSMLQDNLGLLYFGLSSDVIQYDGHTWRPLGIANVIYDIAQDNNGIIYVALNNDFGYFGRSKNGKLSYHSLSETLPVKSQVGVVWWIESTTNKIYFGTSHKIYEYDLKAILIKTYDAKPGSRFAGVFVHHGVVYVRSVKEGLMMIEKGQLIPAPYSSFFANPNAFREAMNRNPSEKIIAMRKNGLFVYSPELNTPPIPLTLSNPEFLIDNDLYTAHSSKSGYHLIGSTNKGAILIDNNGNQINKYDEQNSLQVNGVISTYHDQQDNLWLGLDNGMSKTEHGMDISYWNKHNGLKGGLSAIYRYKGTLYVGADQNAFYINKNNEPIPLENLTPGSQSWAFTEFRCGTQSKLLLSRGDGIYEVERAKAKQIFNGGSVTFLHQSRINPNRLYTCDRHSLTSLRYENEKWIREGTWEGVEGEFRTIEEDTDGTLWIGTNQGGIISVIPDFKAIQRPKTITYYSTKDGLPSTDFYRVFSYNKDIIFGTSKGLYQFNKTQKKFEPYCKISKMLCDGSTEVLLFDNRLDSIILVSPNGNKKCDIGFLQRKGDSFIWNYKPFRRLPEMGGIDAIWVDDDQTFWIGGNEGLFKYDRRKDTKDYNKEFNCLIRKVIIHPDSVIFWGNSTTTSEAGQLSYSQNSLTFEFAAPFFDKEENTRYSFQLVGFDNTWSGWSNQAFKEFTNLKEGEYTFQVKAKNIYDKESKIATYSFRITPPWFRSWWAYISYMILLIAFVRVLVLFRTKKLEENNLVLENKIKERTKELSLSNSALQVTEEELRQNNEALSTSLDNLKIAQQQLVNSEKMASLGQLTAGIAHEINNPLTFIWGGIQALQDFHKDTIEMLKSGVPDEAQIKEREEEFVALMKSVDNGVSRITKIISSLRVFSSPVEGIPEDASIDVRECIESSLILLNSKLFNKNIEIIRNFSQTPNAKANNAQLNQVLLNLIDNAIQALDEIQGKRTLELSTGYENDMVIIKIKDNGPGIPVEYQDKIMNPFFTTKEVGKGTGLGLSISYGIIQKHQGKIEFISQVGVGTEFCIWIPKVEE